MSQRLSVPTVSVEELRFTEREWAVVEALVQETGTAQIAAMLGISVHTARRHIERVMMKLRISSRHDVRQALGVECDCARVKLQALRARAKDV
jgi:DNA-binding NarL/FixJ family response regulator